MKKKQTTRGRPPLPEDRVKSERIEFRSTKGERQSYSDAADAVGLEVSEWIRERLNKAAGRDLRD